MDPMPMSPGLDAEGEIDVVHGDFEGDVGDEQEEDIFIVGDHGTEEDRKFDSIVGALEEIIMDPSFDQPQVELCRRHCHQFDEAEENKLVYMEIFKEYTFLVESAIEHRLTQKVPGFSMNEFLGMLKAKEHLEGDVFDLLLTLSDFAAFKELMLSHKHAMAAEKQAAAGQSDDGGILSIVARKMRHEDGDSWRGLALQSKRGSWAHLQSCLFGCVMAASSQDWLLLANASPACLSATV
eukprot:jgi/Mesvir1/25558/Mv01795-RA.1